MQTHPFLLAFSILFSVIGVAMTADVLMRFEGATWDEIGKALGVFVLGWLSITAVSRLWRRGWRGEQVSVDSDGICDQGMCERLIRWDEIRGITYRTIENVGFFEIDLKDAAAIMPSMNALQRP